MIIILPFTIRHRQAAAVRNSFERLEIGRPNSMPMSMKFVETAHTFMNNLSRLKEPMSRCTLLVLNMDMPKLERAQLWMAKWSVIRKEKK